MEINKHTLDTLMYPLDTLSAEKGIRSRKERRREKAELPPPMIPRAVLKRYHTCDGRLVIESGRLPGFFRAHRENNRLTIDVVSFYNDNEQESEDIDHDVEADDCDSVNADEMMDVKEKELVTLYRYDYGVRSNPCMSGIKIPVMRHVLESV